MFLHIHVGVSCLTDVSPKDIVSGLNGVMFNDLMENIEWFFNLHDKNKDGFLKAFSDQPEYITSGISPLRKVLKELQLRNVHIYPR